MKDLKNKKYYDGQLYSGSKKPEDATKNASGELLYNSSYYKDTKPEISCLIKNNVPIPCSNLKIEIVSLKQKIIKEGTLNISGVYNYKNKNNAPFIIKIYDKKGALHEFGPYYNQRPIKLLIN